MNTIPLIKRLNEQAEGSERKGYKGDSANYWFEAEVLKLLQGLNNNFKELEKQMKYLWQTLDELREDKPATNVQE